MRLGILSDIHEHVGYLRRSLDVFQQEAVDQIVLLGDVVALGVRLRETIGLLESASIVGVWGNHDFGLCTSPTAAMRERYGEPVIELMGRLQPRLEIDDCLFTHVEPWLDAEKLEDLWWFEGLPETPERVALSFSAVPQRALFVGHFHRWFLRSSKETGQWDGTAAVRLQPDQRYLIGIHAVVEGHCAIYDTATQILQPFDLTGR